ncbi:hypothetical protein [Pseudoroseicyclus sp. CXY001]|uniref:hypothetical protein n=1 Tax=Pseudoroseicyclus sp. CXY001 TaxID=3242492 RepID=UPI00358DD61E
MTLSKFSVLLLPLAAAACSSTGIVDAPIYSELPDGGEGEFRGEAATIYTEVATRNNNDDAATALPISGAATYSGDFAAVIDVPNTSTVAYSTLFGDSDMQVNFGTRAMTGTFNDISGRNYNGAGSSTAFYDFNGVLVTSGTLTGNGIDGDVGGTIYDGFGGSYTVDADLDATLTGPGATGMLGIFGGTFRNNSGGTNGGTAPIEGVFYGDR